MIANFIVKTKAQVFDTGIKGGVWEWTLRESLNVGGAVSWNTVDPVASHQVTEGIEYTVVCRRLSTNNGQLGEGIGVNFVAEAAQPPEGVTIDVASSMTVSIQG